jgi:hypothetical protein
MARPDDERDVDAAFQVTPLLAERGASGCCLTGAGPASVRCTCALSCILAAGRPFFRFRSRVERPCVCHACATLASRALSLHRRHRLLIDQQGRCTRHVASRTQFVTEGNPPEVQPTTSPGGRGATTGQDKELHPHFVGSAGAFLGGAFLGFLFSLFLGLLSPIVIASFPLRV